MYSTGEMPGKGSYECTKCEEVVIICENTDALPVCPYCHGTTWGKDYIIS